MKRKSLHEIKYLCELAFEKSKRSVEIFSKSDNPQVVEMRIKHEARAEAFEAVIDAFNGDAVLLRLFGEE